MKVQVTISSAKGGMRFTTTESAQPDETFSAVCRRVAKEFATIIATAAQDGECLVVYGPDDYMPVAVFGPELVGSLTVIVEPISSIHKPVAQA